MLKYCFLLTLVLLSFLHGNAQSTEDSVKATVNKLFEGMKNSDASLITASFADSAVLQTIGTSRDGKTIIRNEKVSGFAESVSKSAKGDLDERIDFGSIKIDGGLAKTKNPMKKKRMKIKGKEMVRAMTRIMGIRKIKVPACLR